MSWKETDDRESLPVDIPGSAECDLCDWVKQVGVRLIDYTSGKYLDICASCGDRLINLIPKIRDSFARASKDQ